MKTDIEHLHKVINGEVTGIGCGKTFAKLHMVAGFLEVGYPIVYCKIIKHRDLEYIFPMLRNVFDEHGLTVKPINQMKWQVNEDSFIQFIMQKDLDYGKALEQSVMIELGYDD